MPVDRDLITKESSLVSVAEAIRTRGNTSSVINYPNGFVSAIGDIGNYMVGATVAWNQLLANGNFVDSSGWSKRTAADTFTVANNKATLTCGSAEISYLNRLSIVFTFISGHKYFISCEGQSSDVSSITLAMGGTGAGKTYSFNVESTATRGCAIRQGANDTTLWIYATNGMSVGDSFTVASIMIIDLTTEFGPTIADALFTLESGTVGAGAAKFRELFNESYYPYDAGSLKSVQYSEWQQNSPIVLNGILNLVNNVWVRDGDIYNNGEVTRKYGSVDLGTLEWTFYTPRGFQSNTAITGIKTPATDNDYASAICSQYIVTTANAVFASTADKIFAIRANGKIVIHDAATLSMTDAQFAAAMSGVYLVYELATPYIET